MELQLINFILFPLIGIGLELLLPKIFKKATGISTIIFSALTLALAFFFCNEFDTTQKGVQFIYSYPWINEWGMFFKLGLDGISCLGITLFSFVFFIILLLSRKKERTSSHYIMIALLQITVIGFLLSYDFVLKILFWEASWIPVFFLLVISSKKKFAILYSKYWFLSEALIVIGTILLFKATGISYDLEKISQVHAGEKITLLIMSLMIIGTMIRSAVFPFSLFMDKAIQSCEESISAIIITVTTVIPFFFMISIIVPLFLKELATYTDVIAVVLLLSLLVCIIRLFIDKKITTIIYSLVLMFNAMTFIWILRPNGELLNASLEILITKTILNIVLIYSGKTIYDHAKKSPRLNTWLFFIAIILSFGIPGIINITPIFKLVSSWYSIAPYVSISAPILIAIIFIYIFINSADLLNINRTKKDQTKSSSAQSVILILVILVSISISIWPKNVHSFSDNYYKTFIGSNN